MSRIRTKYYPVHDHPLYGVWLSIRQRCINPSNTDYKYYGERGIRLCDRWQTFANFVDDMGERPTGMTVDRIDPNQGYEPSNCRWATWHEQQVNRRFQTHCKRGHELTPENTGRSRGCRICSRARGRVSDRKRYSKRLEQRRLKRVAVKATKELGQ